MESKPKHQAKLVVRSIFVAGETVSGDGSRKGRLLWALSTQWNLRRITTPCPARNIPPFSQSNPTYVPSRAIFIRNRVVVIFVSIGYMALVSLLPHPSVEDFSSVKVKLLSRLGQVSHEEFRAQTSATLSWIVGIGATSQICYNAIAIVFVGFGFSEPVMWPPLLGSFAEVYSMRNWWG